TFFGKMQSEYCFEAGRWEAEGSLGALPSHLAGLSVPHDSKPCLCGCSLRTKAMLHPRPAPAPRPASRVLPNLSSGRKQLSSPVTASFKSQLSQSSPKPKAKAKSQLLSWDRSRVCCNATPLRRLVPMGVWPQGFLNPLPLAWELPYAPGVALRSKKEKKERKKKSMPFSYYSLNVLLFILCSMFCCWYRFI
uniref:Uncharacterized protein n=1 Tax=Sus scrofa TaxID=9823 RepID=A0A8D0SL25_PIG